MKDVENELPTRLTALADSIAADGRVSADDVVATYRHRRRARAGALASVAAVVAIAVGVPVGLGSLSSAPAGPAAPAPTTEPAPTVVGQQEADLETAAERAAAEEARRSAAAAGEASVAAEAAAAEAAAAEAAPELAAAVSALSAPIALSSPPGWDQWLPEGKPYPGASTEEDMATCPRLAARLGAEFGMEFSYWTGTLPQGPSGCTWVPVPLSYDGPYDYAYLVDVGFVGDGTTVDQLRASYVMGGLSDVPGATPCPSADVPGGSALVRCAGPDDRYDGRFDLLVPDARGAGVWVLSATAQTSTGRTSAEVLTALVGMVTEIYG